MQVLPRLDQDAMPFLVLAFPDLIGGPVRLGRIAFEALAILAGGPAFACASRGGPIQDAIVRQSDQLVTGHLPACSQKWRVAVAAISDHDGPLAARQPQAWDQLAQLL